MPINIVNDTPLEQFGQNLNFGLKLLAIADQKKVWPITQKRKVRELRNLDPYPIM